MGKQEQISFTFFFLGTVALILLAVTVVAFLLNYQRRVQQQQEAFHIQEKVNQRKLLEAALEAQEKERRRIGRDLHDEIGVLLALAKLQLSNIPNLAKQPEEIFQLVREVGDKLSDAISSTRSISHELLPAAVSKFGLVKALDSFLLSVSSSTGIDVDFFADDLSAVNLTEKQAMTIYRVVQELINNSLKHGKPTEIRLDFERTENLLFIFYQDNGAGADLNGISGKSQGLGLKNMEGRVMLLNGILEFETAPGKGFGTRISIPLPLIENS